MLDTPPPAVGYHKFACVGSADFAVLWIRPLIENVFPLMQELDRHAVAGIMRVRLVAVPIQRYTPWFEARPPSHFRRCHDRALG